MASWKPWFLAGWGQSGAAPVIQSPADPEEPGAEADDEAIVALGTPEDPVLRVVADAAEDFEDGLDEQWLPQPLLDDVVGWQAQDELQELDVDEEAAAPAAPVDDDLVVALVDVDQVEDLDVEPDLVAVEIFDDAPAAAADLVVVVLDPDADSADDADAGEDAASTGGQVIEDAPAAAAGDEYIVRARRRRRR